MSRSSGQAVGIPAPALPKDLQAHEVAVPDVAERKEMSDVSLQRAANDVHKAMIRMGLALRPIVEQVAAIARQPAFQTLVLEVAVRHHYADDLCEPEWEVFQ